MTIVHISANVGKGTPNSRKAILAHNLEYVVSHKRGEAQKNSSWNLPYMKEGSVLDMN